ncbi:hypothetical protein M405DRAFT_823728, partial [Rhizopogon salebrosus TDB-379]
IKADSSEFVTGVVWIQANDLWSVERRAFVTTLARVLDSMTAVVTPSAEWNDPQAEQDMGSLLKMRSIVLSFLEKARGDKHLKNSLEADVDIILPDGLSVRPYFLQFIEREEMFLKTLFIVSNANITDEGSLGTGSFAWSYVSTMAIPDADTIVEVAIRVRPSSLSKCPRCWTYTREEEHNLCVRCENIVGRAE